MKKDSSKIADKFISELEGLKAQFKNPLDKGAYLDVMIELLAMMAEGGLPVELSNGKMRRMRNKKIFEFLCAEAHKYTCELAIAAMDAYISEDEPHEEEPLN